MNNEEKYRRNRRILAIIAVIGFIILVIVAIILAIIDSTKNMVVIGNIDSCLTELRGSDRDSLFRETYKYVKIQNEYNGIDTKLDYKGVVRDGSCHNTKTSISGQTLQSADFIIDIEELKYSYKAKIAYLPTSAARKKDSEVDFEPAVLYCLDKEDMIYPDFGCGKAGSIVDEPDPIVYNSGVVMDGCTLSYTTSGTSKSGYALIIKYRPSGAEYSEFRPICYEAVMNRLKEASINPDNYYIYELDE